MIWIRKVNLNFGETLIIVIYPSIPKKQIWKTTRRQRKERKCSSCWNPPVKSLSNTCKKHIKTNLLQKINLPLVNDFSCNSSDSRNLSNSRNRYSPYRSFHFRSFLPHFHYLVINPAQNIVFAIEVYTQNQLHRVQCTIVFCESFSSYLQSFC